MRGEYEPLLGLEILVIFLVVAFQARLSIYGCARADETQPGVAQGDTIVRMPAPQHGSVHRAGNGADGGAHPDPARGWIAYPGFLRALLEILDRHTAELIGQIVILGGSNSVWRFIETEFFEPRQKAFQMLAPEQLKDELLRYHRVTSIEDGQDQTGNPGVVQLRYGIGGLALDSFGHGVLQLHGRGSLPYPGCVNRYDYDQNPYGGHMPRIAIIGAGSLVFSSRLTADILSYPHLADSHFALVDLDEERLGFAGRIVERIKREGHYDQASYSMHMDRREALDGADLVIVSILVGGFEAIEREIDIPARFGVDQAIGDTLTPGGVMRCLRTLPPLIGVARDVMALCPDAWVLNYTNPMAMLCWGINAAVPDVRLVGLCHSVQHTTQQ